ncbi:adhesin [Pseudomonas sp. 5P_3.1_Bac2]|uniref:adhesin n=1 Tax=Pseudomonas sp. 5P_3.1_Bac2 TaxID=2971617 RepID=UPI0021C8AA4D|nr:adhesin [Pseudomonas sp. 5P_3.1_Bac2]MCU1718559.1 adhesin [Pseudomonas sp. 5P_3.1_Bac2]
MRGLWLTPLLLCAPLLAAAPPVAMQATVHDSLHGFNGIASVNQAGGDYQQQSQVRVLAIGAQPAPRVRVEQLQHNSISLPDGIDAQARTQGQAFSHNNGITGLNQSAGIANQNLNLLRITVGAVPQSLDDAVLSQSTAPTSTLHDLLPNQGERVVETSDKAFAGSSGVVQLNQSAGVGNRTANNLSIRVMD